MKKLCAILIIAAFMLPLLHSNTFAATEDYRGWAQGDSRWDDMVMGDDPAATVEDYGCASVSITKILRQSGAVGKGYTPRDFVNHMNTIGNYKMLKDGKSSGSIKSWKNTCKAGIGLTYGGASTDLSTKKAVSKAVGYVEKGYYVIVKGDTKYGTHFCAVDNAKTMSNGYLTIMNSWNTVKNNINVKYSDVFSSLSAVYYFKAFETIDYTKVESGTYYLKNNATGTYVSVKDGIDAARQPAILRAFDGSSAMQLEVTYKAAGSTFRPLCCETRLLEPKREKDAVTSGDTLYAIGVSTKRASNQGWAFQSVEGGYVIHNMSNPKCVLSAVNGELKMQTYSEGKANQIWSLIPVEEYKALTMESLVENEKTSYSIDPGNTNGAAILIAAYYEDERLLEATITNLVLDGDLLDGELPLREDCSKVRLFLINHAHIPLCESHEHIME